MGRLAKRDTFPGVESQIRAYYLKKHLMLWRQMFFYVLLGEVVPEAVDFFPFMPIYK